VVTRRLKNLFSGKRSVSEDWISRLPEKKEELFRGAVRRWESAYAMLSVVLDEALALRAQGELGRARQQAAISAEFARLMSQALVGALDTLVDHGRHFGTMSSVEPLNAAFFRGETAQRIASLQSLLHGVLLSDRARFFHKLRALSATVEELADEFESVATDLAEGTSTQPATCWATLDALHYDLNTCLRESEVILKSFLCTLHDDESDAFGDKLNAADRPLRRKQRTRAARAFAWTRE
jgi:hypothetical protein